MNLNLQRFESVTWRRPFRAKPALRNSALSLFIASWGPSGERPLIYHLKMLQQGEAERHIALD